MVQETEFGTTIVGLVADGRVVLASDRRASAGGMVASKRADKVFPIGDRAALAFTGAVGDAQGLVRTLESEVRLYETRRNAAMSVPALASVTASTMRENPVRVQHVLGGVDADGPHLYTFDAAGGVLEQPYAADGSGGPTAYGVLENEYREDVSVEAARALAGRAVAAASERDLASGNGLAVATVDEKSVELDRYDDPAAVAS
ncbi:proteasome subunit beta [Halorarum halobium]|uniref:proteasome subunit beta n=1 Tax=Halorarum halobium TaxID=3075121 RepID=UPI0028AFA0D8|nr:proteasome subunit beta [Halobaculum sp. XH14]